MNVDCYWKKLNVFFISYQDKFMISIVIPVYNSQHYLTKCVNSILTQSYRDFELILVDDGSTDASLKICDDLSHFDSRIKVFHKKNEGAGMARKYGVQKASGQWIMFVDSDDVLLPNSLILFTPYLKGDFDMIVGNLRINSNKTFVHQINGEVSGDEYISALFLNRTTIGPFAKLFKRELFGKSNWKSPSQITNNEDLLMLISLACSSDKILIDKNLVCYDYLTRSDSSSNSVIMQLNSWKLLFRIIEDLISKKMLLNNTIKRDFLLFKLRKLRVNCVSNGIFISTRDPFFKKLQYEALEYPETRKKIAQIDSYYKQLYIYIYATVKVKIFITLYKLIK